jgi:mono/diheme cytochrome c family protein
MRFRIMPALLAVAASALLAVGVLGAAQASNPGNATRGKALFNRAGLFCGSCHMLKAAGSVGRDGSNLDQTKPSVATVVLAVSKGYRPSHRWPTGMPGYAGKNGELTKAEVQDIAAFVYTATHR